MEVKTNLYSFPENIICSTEHNNNLKRNYIAKKTLITKVYLTSNNPTKSKKSTKSEFHF